MKTRLQLLLALAGFAAIPAWAQDNGPVQVSAALRHDTLPSLRAVAPQPDGYLRWHARDEHHLPLPYSPPGQSDGAVQSAARRAPLAPSLQDSVDGVGNGFTGPDGTFTVQYAPPDTVGAVGTTQYLQIVNSGLAVFDKATKAALYGPVPTNTLWTGFGGQCETDNDGDAIIVFDHLANRWVASQFAVGTTPYLQCVAVSQTADATGAWNRYAFSYGSAFPDYPKMGVWPDAYYETFNMFNGNSFTGAKLCAYDRAAMLAGTAATQQCFQLSNTYGGVLPADLDGPTAPPANAPNYLLNFGTNALNLWKFHVDWANSANTTLTGPASIAVAAFTPACGGGVCVIQPGVHQQLDSLGDRLMFRLAYRNFGDHEALVVNHSVKVGTTKTNPYSGVRWYEIRSPGATPVVYQQSTYAPDTDFRWMGSAAMDGDGNLAVGYSVSGAATFPAVRFAGRLAGDALSTLQTETSIIEGSGAQSGQNLDRWGDYSAMSVDPVDDCTLWFTSEYLQATGAFNWSTRIASIKFAGCGAGRQSQTISFTSTAPGAATFGGAAYTVTATATSGLPVTLTVDASAAGVCALSGSASGSQVTFTGVGTCTIDANQPGNTSYSAAPQVQQAFSVGKAAQSISFTSTAPAGATFNGSAYTVTASASSGLAVALSVDPGASTVCQLDGSTSGSHVSFIGAGTCIIDANQAGNTNYLAAPQAQQTFAVAQAAQSISFTSTAPANATFNGSTYTITASASSSLAVALTVDATASTVCQLDGSTSGSHVSFIGVGTCTIDANQAGNANYLAAPQAQQTFAVAPAAQTIAFDSTAPAPAMAGGATYQVLASATSGLAVSLSVDVSSAAVCALDGSASGSNVSFTHAGTCTIDASQAGNANYAAATPVQQSFSVVPGPPVALVFTTEPADIGQGSLLGTIAVTEKDAVGDVVDDNGSVVEFSVGACSGTVAIGSAVMAHGVATLTASTLRFYTLSTYAVAAQTGALNATSTDFAVLANSDEVLADGFEACRP